MPLPSLTKGHIYYYSFASSRFVGIFESMDSDSYRFKFLFYINYSGTWDLDYFTCDYSDNLTHVGSPTDFPEYLL